MTEIWKRIYKENIVGILKELADKEYQLQVWLNTGRKPGMTISFVEAACMLFDDCVIGHYLRDNEIILDEKVTQALWELDAAVDAVPERDKNGEFRLEKDIINDPLMDVVREKAARALFLVNVSTGEGSTVDIAVPGQSYPGEKVEQ